MNNTNPNREKNMEHDNREVIRPKTKFYEYKPLEEVIRQWVTGNK
jgi:hypothetical protein